MPPTTPEFPAGVGAPGNVGMIFLVPYDGYVPGERAGFSEAACTRLYDAGVAKYINNEKNLLSLPSAMMNKLSAFFGGSGGNAAPAIDAQGLPVNNPLPPAQQVHPAELLNHEPVGSPSGRTGPPAPTPGVKPGPPVTSADGTAWPPPDEVGVNVQEEPARPDELLGKKRK